MSICIIQMCSGIPCGRVLNGDRALCTMIAEVNLSAFIYRLFHEDFSSIVGINPIPMTEEKTVMKQPVDKCR